MRYLLYTILAASLASAASMATAPGTTEPPATLPAVQEPSPPASSPGNDRAPDRSQEDELEPFTPSEKVPADSAISFPVDI